MNWKELFVCHIRISYMASNILALIKLNEVQFSDNIK